MGPYVYIIYIYIYLYSYLYGLKGYMQKGLLNGVRWNSTIGTICGFSRLHRRLEIQLEIRLHSIPCQVPILALSWSSPKEPMILSCRPVGDASMCYKSSCFQGIHFGDLLELCASESLRVAGLHEVLLNLLIVLEPPVQHNGFERTS